MPKFKKERSGTSQRTPAYARPRERKLHAYPDWDSPDSPAGQVEFGFAAQKDSLVYQYGQARVEAGLTDATLRKQSDSQSWENYFGADLGPKEHNFKRDPAVKQEPRSPGLALRQKPNPYTKPASQTSSSSTTVSDHPARRTSAASNSNSGSAVSTRTTAIRKDKRKAEAMAEALEKILTETPCKKHSQASYPRSYDAEHDVFMCSCTDQAHIID